MRRDGLPTRRPSNRLGGFNPATDISGLALWLRGDLGVTLNGSDVSAWADQSGNARNATQATGSMQPPFVASDANLNGRPSVLFSGTTDILPVGGTAFTAAWVGIVARSPGTTFPTTNVAMARTAGTDGFLIGDTGTANWITTGGAIAGTRRRNAVTTNVALGTANQPFLYEFEPTVPGSSSTHAIGGFQAGTPFAFAGAIAEVVCATAIPNAATLALFRAYVARRYGFAI